ncbi:MAG: preprotein translocase subunit YajC [bacterium]
MPRSTASLIIMAQPTTPANPTAPAPTAAPAPAANVTKEVIGVPSGEARPLVPAGTTAAPGSPTPAPSTPPPGGSATSQMFFPLILMGGLVLLIAMQWFGGRKEKQKRVDMLGQLARNDRIVTTGGIVGQIAEIHEGELVIKTDDASNTRVRIVKSAVANVLKKADSAKA